MGIRRTAETGIEAYQYPFTVKDDSEIVIAWGEHHLVVENRMYPIPGVVRGPTQFPPQRVMEEWAMSCSALQYSVDPAECWKRHRENPLAKLTTQITYKLKSL